MAFHIYASLEETIQDKLTDVTNEDDQETVGRMIEAVSAFVDRYTKRPNAYYMPAGMTATPRYYVASNRNTLQVGRHVPESLTIQHIQTASFEVRENIVYSLYATGDELGCGLFKPGCQYIVSARWGYLETPAEIIEATKQIVQRWFEEGRGTLGRVTPDGFVLERDLPLSAKTLLAGFIKNEYELN